MYISVTHVHRRAILINIYSKNTNKHIYQYLVLLCVQSSGVHQYRTDKLDSDRHCDSVLHHLPINKPNTNKY